KNHPVPWTFARPFAVNGLRTGSDDFPDRQIVLPDYFEHLRGAERIYVHKFCDLGHVTAVRRLVKNDVDVFKRGRDDSAIAQIAVDEFGTLVDPGRLAAAMRLRLQIIQNARPPAYPHQQINHVRADQACSTSY